MTFGSARSLGAYLESAMDEVKTSLGILATDARSLASGTARLVAELPEGEREVLLLAVFEELSYEEIATALGIPIGTVRSRLNRARGRLRELLGRNGQREDVGDNPRCLETEP